MAEQAENPQEMLMRLQQELSAVDPCIAELDINDPDAAFALVILAGVVKGNSITIEAVRKDGVTEAISMEPTGFSDTGTPTIAASIDSTDGTLSPGAADLKAELLAPDFQHEIDKLIGE